MDSTSAIAYSNLTKQLESYGNIIPKGLITSFRLYTEIVYKSDLQDSYSQPVPWIGMYIASASLVCILAMMADLLHGFRNRIRWFPSKYFTLNSASLSIIGVAIKIPMDLTGLMPSRVDQVTKIGSMAFMCTMMANSLPCLATMNDQQLVANVVGLGVLMITLVVNVCIQIYTGVITYPESQDLVSFDHKTMRVFSDQNKVIACIYVVMLLLLLIIYTSSALAISESKRILEKKHRVADEEASKKLAGYMLHSLLIKVHNLRLFVSRYWIMAKTVTPEFMTVCYATACASGVICVLSTILFSRIALHHIGMNNHDSDYKWSIPVIFVTQFIGVILGTIAPLFRCFPLLYWTVTGRKDFRKYCYVFKVEKYWTHKLSDWRGFPVRSISQKCKVVVNRILKIIIFSVCVCLQKTVVVACKMVALIPIIFLFCLFCMFRLFGEVEWGCMLSTNSWLRDDQLRWDMENYLLQVQDESIDATRTLDPFLTSFLHAVKKAEKQQPKYLMKLLKKSTSFESIRYSLQRHDLLGLTSMEYLECWSLSLVTMTTIATSLPDIRKDMVKGFLWSMAEGLSYVSLVEERLNATDEYPRIQGAACQLWLEVISQGKWLGNRIKVRNQEYRGSTRQILEWFNSTSIRILTTEIKNKPERSQKCNCAISMYQTTQSILLSYQDNISPERLYDQLLSWMADILAACLTNLPYVIALECNTNMTQEREAGVHVAVQLLGETTQIINFLQDHNVPRFNHLNQLAFIGEWRKYYEDESHVESRETCSEETETYCRTIKYDMDMEEEDTKEKETTTLEDLL